MRLVRRTIAGTTADMILASRTRVEVFWQRHSNVVRARLPMPTAHDERDYLPILHAMTWAQATGWPTRAQDLDLAARIWNAAQAQTSNSAHCGEWYTTGLLQSFVRTGPDAEHRVVMARIALQLSGHAS